MVVEGVDEEEEFGEGGVGRVGTHTKGGRKGQKTQKLDVIECHCYHHLKGTHNATVNGVALQDGCGSDAEECEAVLTSEPQNATLFYVHENHMKH